MRWKHSRLTLLLDRKEPLGLTEEPLNGGYLLEELMNMGATKLLPMTGEVAVDWQDIWFYHKATGRIPSPRERTILKQLSDAYALGKYEGTDPLNIAPAQRIEDE